MSVRLTRRDILRFAGGGAVGFMLTPMPWRLLNDSAVWTQNWPWIPQARRGPIGVRYGACSLCPAGCPVRVRCSGGMPVGIAPVRFPSHSAPAMCAVGLAAHQLLFHPARITEPTELSPGDGAVDLRPVTTDEVISRMRDVITGQGHDGAGWAILDQQPGRAISGLYRDLVEETEDGIYLTLHGGADPLTAPLRDLLRIDAGSDLAVDYAGTGMVVSFGVPFAEQRLLSPVLYRKLNGPNSNSSKSFRLLQVDSRRTRTAQFADEWIQIAPGTEALLALALAHVLLASGGCEREAADFILSGKTEAGAALRDLIAAHAPERVATICRLPKVSIERLAAAMSAHRPTVALAPPSLDVEDSRAGMCIALLNILLGSVGVPGGIVVASNPTGTAPVRRLGEIPDHSLRLLVLDAADGGMPVSWEMIARKLVPETSMVVSLSPYLTDVSLHAKYVLPASAFLETIQESASGSLSSGMTYQLTPACQPAPLGTIDPIEVVSRLAGTLGKPSPTGGKGRIDLLRARVEELHRAGTGEVIAMADGRSRTMAETGSADALWTMMLDGARIALPPAEQSQDFSVSRRLTNVPLSAGRMKAEGEKAVETATGLTAGFPLSVFRLRGEDGTGTAGVLPPAISKLYQESRLRLLPGDAIVNPATAREAGLADGGKGVVVFPSGSEQIRVFCDSSAPPGALYLCGDAPALAVEHGRIVQSKKQTVAKAGREVGLLKKA